MKNYQKPQANLITVFSSEKIANGGLTDWLQSPEVSLSESNITTYEMLS